MLICETITDPTSWPLNVEGGMPATKMVRLHMKETGAGRDKQNDPRQPSRHAQARVKEFRCAKAEQNRCQQIRGGADQRIANSRDDRAHRSDKILGRMIRL